jgi:hypothetical protein
MRSKACFAARAIIFVVAAWVGITPWAAPAEDGKTVRSFYFGNSLTAGTAPEFHHQLAESRGDVWVADTFLIGGSPLRLFAELLFPHYPDMSYPDPSASQAGQADWRARGYVNAVKARQKFENGTWDAVVIQPHQAHLESDVPAAGKLVVWIHEHQPKAQIYLYQTWAVPTYADGNQERPDFASFDYEKFWLRPYADPPPEDDPHPSRIMRTQDYHKKLLGALNKNHANILGDQPIRVVPTGDVMLEVHRRLKTGKLVDADGKPFVLTRRTVIVDNENDRNFVDLKVEQIPFTDISVFYQDFQHQNPGLPRYFDAAVFYAVLFGKKPAGLDYSKYNVFPSKREDGTFDMTSSYVWRPNDNRKFIEISQEVADALADVIWDVFSTDPRTGLRP